MNKNTKSTNEVLASDRVISALIDYGLVFVLSSFFSILFFVMLFDSWSIYRIIPDKDLFVSEQMHIFLSLVPYMCILVVVSSLCFLCKDLFGGRSIGKRIKKMQIVRKNENVPVSNASLILRNLFVLIWYVEFFVYFFSPSQRSGDKSYDTMVVPASESNRQPIDKNKLARSILIVAGLSLLIALICIAISGILYYCTTCLYAELQSTHIIWR